MIREEKRKVIQTLFEEGKKKKEIARILSLDVKTVRRSLNKANAEKRSKARGDKKEIEVDLLRQLYKRCEGYHQRIHEVLMEEFEINLGYSTLTRLIREHGIGQKMNKRCHRVPDMPGEEMQHDTSTYRLKIGKITMRIVCSVLYLRYSKMRYVKFYPYFNRFKMKCFFHEALTYWGYAAAITVIDNTNLAVLHGTGKNAVFNPEMLSFLKPYGFEWLAHEKGHSDRKAGEEKNFHTIETNFFPGRSFESIEDINSQGFSWATDRYARRPQSKTKLIPIELFEEEKKYLNKLPSYILPPYKSYKRDVDQYGYVASDGNFYWLPGKLRGEAQVVEYADRIKIFQNNREVIQYDLPKWGVKNKTFSPEGINTNPYEPKNIKKPSHEEEKRVRELGMICSQYIDFIKSNKSGVKQKHKFIRELYVLSKKTAPSLFTQTLQRAMKYRVASIGALLRIASLLMKRDFCDPAELYITNDYEKRDSYQEGCFSQEVDAKYYQDLIDEKKEDS